MSCYWYKSVASQARLASNAVKIGKAPPRGVVGQEGGRPAREMVCRETLCVISSSVLQLPVSSSGHVCAVLQPRELLSQTLKAPPRHACIPTSTLENHFHVSHTRRPQRVLAPSLPRLLDFLCISRRCFPGWSSERRDLRCSARTPPGTECNVTCLRLDPVEKATVFPSSCSMRLMGLGLGRNSGELAFQPGIPAATAGPVPGCPSGQRLPGHNSTIDSSTLA